MPQPDLILAIDQETTSSRGILFDADGEAHRIAPYPIEMKRRQGAISTSWRRSRPVETGAVISQYIHGDARHAQPFIEAFRGEEPIPSCYADAQ